MQPPKYVRALWRGFPVIPQHDTMDCGPSCLAMIAHYHGKKYTVQEIRDHCFLSKDGVSLLGIQDGAKTIGLNTIAVHITVEQLLEKSPLPCILHWDNNHFVVLHKIRKGYFSGDNLFYIVDPSFGKIRLRQKDFEEHWIRKNGSGLALLLDPTVSFYEKDVQFDNEVGLSKLISFMKPHKKELAILFVGLFLSSVFTLIFPFLTQALIDKGVNQDNLSFVTIILVAQLFLFLGSVFIEVVRNWVLVYINSKININIISEYLSKLIKLPFKFFDSKQLGDFSARIGDHQRIEEFLTSQSLIVIFSSLNFVVFFWVLSYYDPLLLLIYTVLTVLAVSWSLFFLKKLEKIDYQKFRCQSESQQAIYELINGIMEVKLNNCEDDKVSRWQEKQVKLFNTNLRILKFDQIQLLGYDFLNQFKNILVLFIASREVIIGHITLGALLSISYIIGQMNGPLNQLINFLKSWKYAKLSIQRLNEIQYIENEDELGKKKLPHSLSVNGLVRGAINIKGLCFQYHGPRSPKVLDNVHLSIPYGKTTAIVGESGSGKTTLMKLLLKFYPPSAGEVLYGDMSIEELSAKSLRSNSGVVMQDGYIFSDTIMHNITTDRDRIDHKKLAEAIRIANLTEFIDALPQKAHTTIGSGGNGLSGGQKQRILIARAVYKNPEFIFFDEATSALDAENERIIYKNLDLFFKGKTVLKIAHRLSTVQNADQIIVLKQGAVVETGSHMELVKNRSNYYHLVKKQLELSA